MASVYMFRMDCRTRQGETTNIPLLKDITSKRRQAYPACLDGRKYAVEYKVKDEEEVEAEMVCINPDRRSDAVGLRAPRRSAQGWEALA